MRTSTLRRLVPIGLALAVVAGAVTAVMLAPDADAADPVVVVNSTFEDGTVQGWGTRAAETAAVSTAAAHAGTRSLLVSGRTSAWQGPALNVLNTMQNGTGTPLGGYAWPSTNRPPRPGSASSDGWAPPPTTTRWWATRTSPTPPGPNCRPATRSPTTWTS